MKRTPLYDQHVRDASVVINLKGFARAMEYRGHLAEHEAVRERVGLCDVSHMGQIEFKGADAFRLVQKLITNDAGKLSVDQALYSLICNDDGFIIDDLVCLRLAPDHFIWVVNVTKTDDDYQWVLQHSAGMDVTVSNRSTDTALMALQGPDSREVLQRITKADLSSLEYYWLTKTIIYTAHAEVPCVISRTGYTGERGYEIMVARDLAPWVWDELLLVGRPLGIIPHGVAARESLRTEACYLLNGNDIDANTNPFEAGLGWAVKFSKDFIGRSALERLKEKGIRRKLVGLEVQGNFTVRHGYRLYKNGSEIGRVTSGPLLSTRSSECSWGLGYVSIEHADPGTEMEVQIRDRRANIRVVATPLRERRVKGGSQVNTRSPYSLRYSESHVWARIDDSQENQIILGISDFAQRNLGTVLCSVFPAVGDRVKKGASLGWLDSYRKLFDIISPVAGEVVAVNKGLITYPRRINAYPYVESGLVTLRVTSLSDYKTLMGFDEYAALTAQLGRYDIWTSEQRIF